MKRILALAALAVLCASCAQGGAPAGGQGSISMYGTLDEGITFHK
jgi:opacity protein-like surface antigen